LIARHGGEEFSIVLPNCDLSLAEEIVDRLRAAVPHDQTCSAGVARWDGEQPADELMRAADCALYCAKRMGRNRTIVATDVIGPASQEAAARWTAVRG